MLELPDAGGAETSGAAPLDGVLGDVSLVPVGDGGLEGAVSAGAAVLAAESAGEAIEGDGAIEGDEAAEGEAIASGDAVEGDEAIDDELLESDEEDEGDAAIEADDVLEGDEAIDVDEEVVVLSAGGVTRAVARTLFEDVVFEVLFAVVFLALDSRGVPVSRDVVVSVVREGATAAGAGVWSLGMLASATRVVELAAPVVLASVAGDEVFDAMTLEAGTVATLGEVPTS